MLKLYGGAFSRAAIVKWYLEELSVPFEFVLLDMQNGEHKKPEFLAINPMGKVPAIVDGDFQLWESGAILLYLAQKYGNLPDSPEYKATLAQWMLFANATLGPGVFVQANRDREMPALMTGLSSILEKQPFLLGQDFSVADVAVGSMLAYIPIMLKEVDLTPYPAVLDYMKRMTERPAFQKAMQR